MSSNLADAMAPFTTTGEPRSLQPRWPHEACRLVACRQAIGAAWHLLCCLCAVPPCSGGGQGCCAACHGRHASALDGRGKQAAWVRGEAWRARAHSRRCMQRPARLTLCRRPLVRWIDGDCSGALPAAQAQGAAVKGAAGQGAGHAALLGPGRLRRSRPAPAMPRCRPAAQLTPCEPGAAAPGPLPLLRRCCCSPGGAAAARTLTACSGGTPRSPRSPWPCCAGTTRAGARAGAAGGTGVPLSSPPARYDVLAAPGQARCSDARSLHCCCLAGRGWASPSACFLPVE